MHITFEKDLFNPLYFNLEKSYKDKRYMLIYGGAGSGKSHSVVEFCIKRLLVEKNFKLLVCRKYSSTLPNSIIDLFIEKLDFYSSFMPFKLIKKYNKIEKRITLFNDNVIIFSGLDDVEKLKSVNAVSSIVVEEASEISQEDLYQLDARLRGITLVNPNIILIFNPTSTQHWLYKYWFENSEQNEKATAIKTTCEDNKYIDEGYKNTLKGYASIDIAFYKRYYLGEFCDITNEFGIYRHFNETHIMNLNIDENLPLYLSFDFNVNPCVSVTCYQIHGNEIWLVDEFYKFGDNIELTCKRILEKYPNMQMIVTGDPSGKAQNVGMKSGVNYFTLIQNYLVSNVLRFQVPSSAESILVRTNWINQIFLGNQTIKFKISLSCKNTISDIYEARYNKEGNEKDKKTGKINGIVCQLHNHLNDTIDYMFCTFFKDEFLTFKNGGQKKIITIPKKNGTY